MAHESMVHESMEQNVMEQNVMEQKPVWHNFMAQFFEEQPLDQIREKLAGSLRSTEEEILDCVNATVKREPYENSSCDPFSDASISLMEKILGVDLPANPFGPDGFNNLVAKRDRNSLLLKRFVWKRLTKR